MAAGAEAGHAEAVSAAQNAEISRRTVLVMQEILDRPRTVSRQQVRLGLQPLSLNFSASASLGKSIFVIEEKVRGAISEPWLNDLMPNTKRPETRISTALRSVLSYNSLAMSAGSVALTTATLVPSVAHCFELLFPANDGESLHSIHAVP